MRIPRWEQWAGKPIKLVRIKSDKKGLICPIALRGLASVNDNGQRLDLCQKCLLLGLAPIH